MRAVGQHVDVVNRLVLGGVGLVTHFDAAQPLDPGHALHAGHDETQRVAVLRAQHFAVHAVGEQHFAGLDQLHRNGARHAGAIATLGQHVAAFFEIRAAVFQHIA